MVTEALAKHKVVERIVLNRTSGQAQSWDDDDDVEYLCKWYGLDYDCNSWEAANLICPRQDVADADACVRVCACLYVCVCACLYVFVCVCARACLLAWLYVAKSVCLGTPLLLYRSAFQTNPQRPRPPYSTGFSRWLMSIWSGRMRARFRLHRTASSARHFASSRTSPHGSQTQTCSCATTR